MKILFVGLGQMGRRMATRLNADDTAVWNRSSGIVQEFKEKGYSVPTNLSDGVRDADVVITMLRDQEAVRSVGDRGLFSGLRPGQVWVDMTTGAPQAADSFHALAASQGATFVAAPVVGTLGPAQQGTLTVLVGGSDENIAKVRPVLERFGTLHVVGTPRQALVMKLVVNTVLAYYMDAVSECLPVLDAEHISRDKALALLAQSSVAAPVIKGKGQRWQSKHYDQAEFPIELLAKDLDLMTNLATQSGWDLPGVSALLTLFRQASQQEQSRHWDMAGVGEALAHPLGQAISDK
ncbi:NAD(P)-dependent oxidoreductase [Sulfobacillus sp. DSM 109850]|uniref:NAD(P)-dependent oxidoreductase n=2 Tax=Sulfobacillus harzensis TaxID=2729629 RepID=A0A7Y0Q4R4_9FIRM|nr:NAD(P)-dependent oxidoreductase [Sulfobacillus harzensis]NMP23509.1 NAD(P)-dependent oxidoreductase [Sulfobacillus harzensis]